MTALNSARRSLPSREIELSILLSTPDLHDEEIDRARELMREALNWHQVFGALIFHRTSGMAWKNIDDFAVRGGPDRFKPAFMLGQLRSLFRAQQLAFHEHVEYDCNLLQEFDRRDIPCAVMKGAALSRMAYLAPGMRAFGDDDFLFDRSRLADVAEVLREFGYIQGRWDSRAQKVVPASRSEILLHSVTSHETYPYTRHAPEGVFVTEHEIDVHFSVDLLTSRDSDSAVRDMLKRRIRVNVGDASLWSLHQNDMFMFACVHFQREACNRREVENGLDLALYKLVDLVGLLSGSEFPIDLDNVVARARKFGFVREVYFSLAYMDTLFPGRVPERILKLIEPESLEYLHEVTHNDRRVHTWARPIVERFFDPLRQLELPDA